MKDPLLALCRWKTALFFVLIPAILGLSGPAFGQSCAPPPLGLVSWWPGEGNGIDLAGGNNGILQGGVIFAPGEVNQAFVFNGTSSGVVVGNPANLQLQNFTIEAWVKRGSTNQASLNAGGGVIFGYGQAGYGFILADNGVLSLGAIGISGVQSIQAVTDTAFHHVAVTKNGNSVVFYLDGVAGAPITYNVTFQATTSAAIGVRPDTSSNSLLGDIDEISVYNRVLSASEIQAIFNAGSAGKCTAAPPVISSQPVGQTLTAGNNTSFSAMAAGTPPLSFQWQLNSNNVAGATNTTLTLLNAQLTDAGNYSVLVSNAFGVGSSSNALLTVNPAVCTPAPSGLVGWWQGEGNAGDAAGGNSGSLFNGVNFAPGKVGQAFSFSGTAHVRIHDAPNLRVTNGLTIEAWVFPVNFTSQHDIVSKLDAVAPPGNQRSYGLLIRSGGQLVLSVGSNGTTTVETPSPGPLPVNQWSHVAGTYDGATVKVYINGILQISAAFAGPIFPGTDDLAIGGTVGGEPNGSLIDPFAGLIDEASVYNRALTAAEIQGLYNASTAGKCATPPSILTQPSNQTALPGTNANLSVVAAGAYPLSYQWSFNGTILNGATNSSLVLNDVQLTNAGIYQVTITNALGSVVSSNATLVVQGPPAITLQPQNQAVPLGDSAAFFVDAFGPGPLHYQWQFNGSNLPGATNYFLELDNVQVTNAGPYNVIITNAFGSIASTSAVLTVLLPPSILAQPQSQTNFLGGNAALSVTASGSPPLAYQWKFMGSSIPGATSPTLQLNGLQPGNAGAYSVTITNLYGATNSLNAFLTISNPVCTPMPSGLVGWWQGENSTRDAISGTSGTLIGNATFAPGKVDQAFSFDGSGDAVLIGTSTNFALQDFTIEAWVKRSSTNQASLTAGGGCIFSYGSGGYGFALHDDGTPFLTAIENSDVTGVRKVNDTAFHHLAVTKNGTNVTFYVDGVLDSSVAYSVTFSAATPVAIGARGDNFTGCFLGLLDEVSVYNRALSAAEIQAIYAATTLGKCGVPLSVSTQPTNQSLTVGGNIILNVPITGTGPVTYQWFQNGAAISGATNATLVFTNTTFFQAGTYILIASNSLGGITSSNFVLTIKFPPLLVNGSFETGDFTGWVTNDLNVPLYPLTVRHAGFNPGFDFFLTAPTDGSFAATHGFEGDGPGKISIAQDVVLPSGPANLTFDYRAAWDMSNYSGSTLPRTLAVTIAPAGGGTPLQTFPILTAAPGTADFDTGPLNGSLDLTAYSARGLRISFDATVPEFFTGPGFFQLDNVVLSYSLLPPLLISQSGSNVVLSWPASSTNYTLQTSGDLTLSNSWTAIDTNLIVHAPTNTSVMLPITTGPAFYRLIYP